MEIIKRPSPNFNARKGATAKFLILHFTAMDSADAACERLCDPEFEVSAHYLIGKDGAVTSMVDEHDRAWHAGASYWHGITDMNSHSIGIELDNNGGRPFEDAQYEALIALLKSIQNRHDIPPQHVLGHQDIAIARKFDPGAWFDWARLEAAGVASPPKWRGFEALAHYQCEMENGRSKILIKREIEPSDIQTSLLKDETEFRRLAASAGYDGDADLNALLTNIRIRHGATPFFGELRDEDFELLR